MLCNLIIFFIQNCYPRPCLSFELSPVQLNLARSTKFCWDDSQKDEHYRFVDATWILSLRFDSAPKLQHDRWVHPRSGVSGGSQDHSRTEAACYVPLCCQRGEGLNINTCNTTIWFSYRTKVEVWIASFSFRIFRIQHSQVSNTIFTFQA